MPEKTTSTKRHIVYHKNGGIWAKGKTVNRIPDGYWEWFRKDGIKMRSGHFKKGKQVGEWITYDKAGKVYKITSFNK
jgi:antitoxin component YwqK of YwqJK toxin-antitoxin module